MSEMLNGILIFLVTSVVSFTGSIQVGPVNFFVLEATLQKNRKAGMLVAIGGCIPEFIYSILALAAGLYLQQLPGAFLVLRIVTAIVLLVIGIAFLLKKRSQSRGLKQQSDQRFLLKGFVLGMLNPQLLPFWLIVYTSFFSLTGISIDSLYSNVGFVAGTGCGAFALHLVLIYFSDKFREKLNRFVQHQVLHKVIGGIFVLMAVLQAFSL